METMNNKKFLRTTKSLRLRRVDATKAVCYENEKNRVVDSAKSHFHLAALECLRKLRKVSPTLWWSLRQTENFYLTISHFLYLIHKFRNIPLVDNYNTLYVLQKHGQQFYDKQKMKKVDIN